MSRTVKHPNACPLPGCWLCHNAKRVGWYETRVKRLRPRDRRRVQEVDLPLSAIRRMWEEAR